MNRKDGKNSKNSGRKPYRPTWGEVLGRPECDKNSKTSGPVMLSPGGTNSFEEAARKCMQYNFTEEEKKCVLWWWSLDSTKRA